MAERSVPVAATAAVRLIALVLCLAVLSAALSAGRAAAHDGWGGMLHLLDAAHAERAVAAAERLAGSAGPAGDGAGGWSEGLVGHILAAAGDDAAARALADSGYAEPDLAIGLWAEEMTQVLAAYRALVAEPAPRPAREIAAELDRLPIVPLDEAGARERAALMRELAVASAPPADRAAVAPFVGRIRVLEASLGTETGAEP